LIITLLDGNGPRKGAFVVRTISSPGQDILEIYLHVVKAPGYPRSYPTRSFGLACASLQWVPTRTTRNFHAF
jgi:hypothetical protein